MSELRTGLRLLAGLVTVCLLWSVLQGTQKGKAKASSDARPNLLLVTFDTTRADRLPPYGYDGIKTPALSRLASQGVTFLRMHSQSPQTLPSHTSLFTGLYTITHNVRSNGQRLEPNAITLAEVLRAEGYQTGAVVATAALLEDFGLGQGFQTYNDDFEDAAISGAIKSVFRFFSRNKINLYSTRPANRVSTLARRWLSKAAKKDRPFFLWVHFFDPHTPYLHHPDFDRPSLKRRSGTQNRYGQLEKNYLNEIEFADHYLGKLLNHLDRLGLSSNTLVAFSADHGESLGEHGYTGHRGEVYENIIRIPLILRFPGRLRAGQRLDTPAMSIDVVPTLLKLMSIDFPDSAFAGEDLFALDPHMPRRCYSLAVKLFTKSPIRTALLYGGYKYIQFDDPSHNLFFSLSQDPEEGSNLIKAAPLPESGLDWTAAIQDWFDRYEELTVSDFEMTAEQMER
ncbi:MAG: sulfatase, partial [Acidobacteriota bacterium]